MSCRPFADAVVDDGLPRPPGLEAHLATCVDCRALADGHARALRLQGASLALRPRVAAVSLRLAAIAAVLLAVLGVGLYLRAAPAPAPVAVELDGPQPGPAESATVHVANGAEHGGEALTALREQIAQLSHADVTVHDPSYKSFRALPVWIAPSWSHPKGETP